MQSDAVEIERAPQPGKHDDLFDVDVGTGEAQSFGVELVKLTVASLLWTLVPEHRSRGPHPLRPLVGETVLNGGCRLGSQRETLAVETVRECVHLFLDDVGDFADRAHEQRGRFDQRHLEVAIAVMGEDFPDHVLEVLPQGRLIGQHVVHAAHGLDDAGHRYYATALIATDFLSGLR